MERLNFSRGKIKKFCINDDENAVISINMEDFGIFKRAKESEKFFKDMREKYDTANPDELILLLSDIDSRIRQQIDYIFGSGVSETAFGTVNCFSFVDGQPMFIGFLDAILPVLEKEMTANSNKFAQNISKYTSQVNK